MIKCSVTVTDQISHMEYLWKILHKYPPSHHQMEIKTYIDQKKKKKKGYDNLQPT